jgi:hypothetical protein
MPNAMKVAYLLGGLVALTLIILLIVMALLNSPVSDNYAYFNAINEKGVWGFIVNEYTTWSGRLLQTVSLGVGYRIFGEQVIVIAPILLLLVLGGVFSWLTALLFRFKKNATLHSVVIGFLIASGGLFAMRSLHDSWLWLDSALIYVTSLIALVFTLCVAIMLSRNEKLSLRKVLPLLILIAITQTASEPSCIIAIGWCVLWFVFIVMQKKWHQLKPLLMISSAVFIGFLIMVLSPGLSQRQTYMDSNDFGLIDMLLIAPFRDYQTMFESVAFWSVTIAIFSGVVMGISLMKKITGKMAIRVFALALAIFASLTYVTFVAVAYGYKDLYLPSRALALPNFGLFIMIVMLTAVTVGYLRHKLNLQRIIMSSVVVITIMSIMSMKSFAYFVSDHINALAVRRSAVSARVASIEEQKKDGRDIVVVYDLPVILYHSDATDFSADGYIAWWFPISFAGYHGISPESLVVIGGPIVDDVNATRPEWYTEQDKRVNSIYCVPGHYGIIKDRFLCWL